jgi:hypothetical protein
LRGVAFLKHETITIIRVRILRIELHRVKKYSRPSSAADMHQVGCPEPAAVVAIIE